MYHDYAYATLAEEDRMKLAALEGELTRKYGREVILIAYEKPSESDASPRTTRSDDLWMEVGQLGVDSNRRGTTFGYEEAHGDHYPTLGMLMYGRMADGEDIRFEDAEPPNRDAEPKKP